MSSNGSVLVIGSGAAGRSAARALAAEGFTVTVVEQDRVGGTCLWRGCIPKKALYAAARSVRDASRATQFGVDCDGLTVDWQEVLAWKWHAQESFAGDQTALLEARGIRVLCGTARFVSESEVEVEGERLTADHIIIATGSVPVLPDVPGIELASTSEDALRFAEPPRSMVVVGAGFIAMELAAIFASFGTQVSVLHRGERVLPMLDQALAEVATRRLESMGVKFFADARLESIVAGGDDSLLTVNRSTGGSPADALMCERVLVATGRRPDLAHLELPTAGVEVDAQGRLVLDGSRRTTNPRIWACGDATGGMMQTPVAALQGGAVAAAILSGRPTTEDFSAIPVTCFTTPQLASVGLTAHQAEERGIAVRVNRVDAASVGAAIVDDERDAFTQLVIRTSDGVIVGAQIAGPTASDTIYAAAVAIKAQMTAEQLQAVVGVHPSYAEAVYYAAW